MPDRRDAILDAAIELADAHGLAAVSMRALAERVGVTPMALYPYVGSKAALLDAMQGKLLAELLPVPGPDRSWQERLRRLAHTGRALSQRHPWVSELQFQRPAVAPDAVRVVDAIYQALIDAGIAAAEIPRLERMLSTFIIGFGASEAGGRFDAGTADPRARRSQLPAGQIPAYYRLAEHLDRHLDLDAEFEADIADLERLISAKAGLTRGAQV